MMTITAIVIIIIIISFYWVFTVNQAMFKAFTCNIVFNPYNNLAKEAVLLSLFYR